MIKLRLINAFSLFGILLVILLFDGCKGTNDQGKALFKRLPASQTGVTFVNQLTEREDFNIFNYMYFYNGGGVAAGDLNGDDLPELFFTSNMEENRLYLNKGNMRFEDITDQADVGGPFGWSTGVAFVDINQDRKLDIYVSHVGDYLKIKGRNRLYINMGNDPDGNPVFEENAAAYGLDLVGFCTQASFFDYDLDGDLDLFLLNHSLHQNGTFGKSDLRYETHPLAGDRLLRNDQGRFIDVTDKSGLYSSVMGYGLGVMCADINNDGYPDIYVANDFHENDYLYLNNGDGTFTESMEDQMGHTSRFSMGTDIEDINNDGYPDIIALDMLPEDPEILKASAGEDPYDVYQYKKRYGYSHQFSRNTLQLNNGNGTFSEIARYSGIHATDWSWTPLMLDFNYDGYKDIFISNGILRRPNDMDYINFVSSVDVQSRLKSDVIASEDLEMVKKMPVMKLHNYMFKGQSNLQFEDVSEQWGFEDISFSHGAIYSDLDQDGDPDIICNNTQGEAFIYENRLLQKGVENSVNYLKFRFEGAPGNTYGVGTKVRLNSPYGKIWQEFQPVRGYQSTMDHELLVGLGSLSVVDTILVIWPGGKTQTLTDITSNQVVVVKQAEAREEYDYSSGKSQQGLFKDITSGSGLEFKHEENIFVEFNREKLIPHMVSTAGPALSVGDINGDGLEDVFLGGAKRQAGRFFLQNSNGRFSYWPQKNVEADSVREDVLSRLFDADSDGDLDLIVAPGGNEFRGESFPRELTFYTNDGEGNFERSPDFPEIFLTTGALEIADYDEDGDLDIFVGGRAIPWNYGMPPDSYLLQNSGSGSFKNVTSTVAPGLSALGLINDAAFGDFNQDGTLDLALAGEWMPITFFFQKNGVFTPSALVQNDLINLSGLWNTCLAEDVDQDGDLDLVLGNLGLNSKLRASPEKPVRLYLKDFDNNGKLEQVLTYYLKDKEFLFHTKEELTSQLPQLNKRYLSHWDFAKARFTDIFPPSSLENARLLECREFRSGILINNGDEGFDFNAFPEQVQLAPAQDIIVDDFNKDGDKDILLVGNFYDANIQMGIYDASYGELLTGNGKGDFQAMPYRQSGLKIKGQSRAAESITLSGSIPAVIVARNNDTPLIISNK